MKSAIENDTFILQTTRLASASPTQHPAPWPCAFSGPGWRAPYGGNGAEGERGRAECGGGDADVDMCRRRP